MAVQFLELRTVCNFNVLQVKKKKKTKQTLTTAKVAAVCRHGKNANNSLVQLASCFSLSSPPPPDHAFFNTSHSCFQQGSNTLSRS